MFFSFPEDGGLGTDGCKNIKFFLSVFLDFSIDFLILRKRSRLCQHSQFNCERQQKRFIRLLSHALDFRKRCHRLNHIEST